jgi:ApaG protein
MRNSFMSPPLFIPCRSDIVVTVKPLFLGMDSAVSEARYRWIYQIHIENRSDTAAQLLSRSWRIVDANGTTQMVEGDGVVGEQPVIAIGQAFSYRSGVALATPSGWMNGFYTMQTTKTDQFVVEIPAFSLDSPHNNKRAN